MNSDQSIATTDGEGNGWGCVACSCCLVAGILLAVNLVGLIFFRCLFLYYYGISWLALSLLWPLLLGYALIVVVVGFIGFICWWYKRRLRQQE